MTEYGVEEADMKRANLLAVIRKIDAQIHKIVLTPARLVDDGLEHSLVDFVWNVS